MFIGEHLEEIQATQMISQKLTEVAREALFNMLQGHSALSPTNIQGHLAKESFDELPYQKKWDHTIC